MFYTNLHDFVVKTFIKVMAVTMFVQMLFYKKTITIANLTQKQKYFN